jgi:NACHT domain-containing protein
MAYFKRIKERLSDSKDAADAIADLTGYMTLLVTGTAITGGTLTIPLLVATSAKAASAMSKLANALIPSGKQDSQTLQPAERIDEIFYVLAQRSYLKSIDSALKSLPKDLTFEVSRYTKLSKELVASVVQPDEAEARFQFGWSPQDSPLELYRSYSAYLLTIFLAFGVERKSAKELLARIETNARKSLYQEMLQKKKGREWLVEYQLLRTTDDILSVIKSFKPKRGQNIAAAWKIYLRTLGSRIHQPIWGEEEQKISIAHLFVEPDYTYYQQILAGSSEAPRPIRGVSLQNFVSGLLSPRRPSYELIFIMGGPGSGKTSLAEMFCANLAESEELRIVLVPAKRLDPTKALLPEIQRDLRSFGHEAVADSLGLTPDVVVVIDGFDELAQATRNTLESFFRGASELVRERAATGLRIVLTGRPTLFTKNDVAIPAGSHVITVLPFDRPRVENWSKNWQRAASGSFDGVKYLDQANSDLTEIASQPMLLYLLARMHEDGQPVPVIFNQESGGARFEIYKRILDWVCERQAGKKYSREDSVRIRRFLQIAGLATHQSGQRVLHWEHLQQALMESGLANEPEDRHAKSYGTILSFAFTSKDQRSWEFTHKSFGEALAAEAIARFLEDITEEGKHGERWRVPLPEVARAWISTCGPHFLTKEILDFSDGWLMRKSPGEHTLIGQRLLELFVPILTGALSTGASEVSARWGRALVTLVGNSIRSLFALANVVIGAWVRISGEKDAHSLIGSLQIPIDIFRQGSLLCHLVTPLERGDFASLFLYTRLAAPFTHRAVTGTYLAALLELKARYGRPMEQQAFYSILKPSQFDWFNTGVLHPDLAWRDLAKSGAAHVFRYGHKVPPPLVPVEKAAGELEQAFAAGFEDSPYHELRDAVEGFPPKGDITDELREEVDKWIMSKLEKVGELVLFDDVFWPIQANFPRRLSRWSTGEVRRVLSPAADSRSLEGDVHIIVEDEE